MADADPVAATAVRIEDVGGRQILSGLRSALAYLQANQDTVNDLNVFPVPDGDTGSNMYLTLRSAVEDALHVEDRHSASAVMAAAAHGSLMGARGNSGVILSQVLRGFGAGLGGKVRVDAQGVASALDQARQVAYKAVMKPTEGTILTVIRCAADAAGQAATEDGADVRSVLAAAVIEAHAAVERTPDLLAVLREAGVVDAGGFGLAIILEGFARALEEGEKEVDRAPLRVNEPLIRTPEPGARAVAADASSRPAQARAAGSAPATGGTEHAARRGAASVSAPQGGFGYCTEFLVNGPGLDTEALRDELGPLGDSSLIVGDSDLVRVHIHTHDPAGLITLAATRGPLTKLKVEDMSAQHHEVLARADALEAGAAPALEVTGAPAPAASGPGVRSANGAVRKKSINDHRDGHADAPRKSLGVVTVAQGSGFRAILDGIGADAVVEGGQTMNPSTQDLLDAVRAAAADSVILLPNNANVILTAQQVDALAEGIAVRVVPSRTVPQGISALLALDPTDGLDQNVERMMDALRTVTTVEITRAVRDTVTNGHEIRTGDTLALVDDEIAQVGDAPLAVIEAALAARDTCPELVTVYRGAGVDEQEAEVLVGSLRDAHPGVEVELHDGGQDHYPYILSLE